MTSPAGPTGPAPRANRLAGESSPYLRLHAHNPVDWYPWGEEALTRARVEEKPIFLSIGYSTCYWCHVMERESFSDAGVAALMNREFVCIKVDREERPDLDDIYMAATQALSEQGGWPNSVFLTPRLAPFFAGTYFPPADRHGRPGFPTVLSSLARAWKERRVEVEQQAAEVVGAIRAALEESTSPARSVPPRGAALRALDGLRRRFDATWGGFGGAPKFPTPANLLLLLELAPESFEAGLMLAATLDQMGRGGLFDALGGGFHRYSVDREWRVPHFEKMLYDNALLLEVYAAEYARSGEPERARVARETVGFLSRELSAPEGGFWCALDAETGGHEGAFYVWTRAELESVLGPEEAAFAAPLLGFDGEPGFEGGSYVLRFPRPLEVLARERRMRPEELLAELAPLRARLLAARALRPRPATDDKVLADWNGLAIAGLAVAGRALDEPAWIDRAARAAEFLLSALRPAGAPLCHVWRHGVARIPAYLADYAGALRGLLALAAASGERRWVDAASELADEMIARLRAPEGGFFNAAAASDLLVRPREVYDGAIPGANALVALALRELAERSGNTRYRDECEALLCAFATVLERQPDAARTLALAARRFDSGGVAAAAVGGETGVTPPPAARSLESEARAIVTPRFELEAPAADGFRRFGLTLEVREGWHLAAAGPTTCGAEADLAPRLAATNAELRRVTIPSGRAFAAAAAGPVAHVLDGLVVLTGEVRPVGPEPFLLLRLQGCDDRRCLPPIEIEIPLS